jgi:hypothetical protein
MSDTVQILVGLTFLLSVFILTRYIVTIRLRNAARSIIEDLEARSAFTEVQAADLPYSKPDILRIGMRDYRRKALEYMVAEGVIGCNADGKYYLKVRRIPRTEN